MLVWNAISSITAMMSTIFFDEALIESIVSTTRETSSPPRVATAEALTASVLAWRAFSAFCLTAPVNSFHRAGGAVERGGLLLGALRQIAVAGADFGGAGVNRLGAAAHFADDAEQAVDHAPHGVLQLPYLVAGAAGGTGEPCAQVARGHRLGHRHRFSCRGRLIDAVIR